LRRDGQRVAVSFTNAAYDLDATKTLIQLFRACASHPLLIFFNDSRIRGVRPLAAHGNHFHVQF
jgi:hypothetical protein